MIIYSDDIFYYSTILEYEFQSNLIGEFQTRDESIIIYIVIRDNSLNIIKVIKLLQFLCNEKIEQFINELTN